jgi:hypothetical protein
MSEDTVTFDRHARTTRFVSLGRRPAGLMASLVLVAGAAVLLGSAIIHLQHLWASGYKNIKTIGPLFLVQGIVGIVLAISVGVIRRVFIAVLGVLFAAGTIAGLLGSVHFGLFGYRETMSAPWATASLVIESAAVVALMLGGGLALWGKRARTPRSATRPPTARTEVRPGCRPACQRVLG